jgi:hypothetical protein
MKLILPISLFISGIPQTHIFIKIPQTYQELTTRQTGLMYSVIVMHTNGQL